MPFIDSVIPEERINPLLDMETVSVVYGFKYIAGRNVPNAFSLVFIVLGTRQRQKT